MRQRQEVQKVLRRLTELPAGRPHTDLRRPRTHPSTPRELNLRKTARQEGKARDALQDPTRPTPCRQAPLLPCFRQDGRPTLTFNIATAPTGQFTRTGLVTRTGLASVGFAASFAAREPHQGSQQRRRPSRASPASRDEQRQLVPVRFPIPPATCQRAFPVPRACGLLAPHRSRRWHRREHSQIAASSRSASALQFRT